MCFLMKFEVGSGQIGSLEKYAKSSANESLPLNRYMRNSCRFIDRQDKGDSINRMLQISDGGTVTFVYLLSFCFVTN